MCRRVSSSALSCFSTDVDGHPMLPGMPLWRTVRDHFGPGAGVSTHHGRMPDAPLTPTEPVLHVDAGALNRGELSPLSGLSMSQLSSSASRQRTIAGTATDAVDWRRRAGTHPHSIFTAGARCTWDSTARRRDGCGQPAPRRAAACHPEGRRPRPGAPLQHSGLGAVLSRRQAARCRRLSIPLLGGHLI